MKILPLLNGLPHTIAALEEFDRTQPERDKLWDQLDSDADLVRAETADQAAVVKVQDAFFEDTKDRNSQSGCRAVPISYLRELVAKHGGGQ